MTIKQLDIDFKVNLLDFDSIASFEVELSHGVWSRRFTAKHKKKTLLPPSEIHLNALLNACLEDFAAEIVSDEQLAASLISTIGAN
jgi:hypothetical protein